MARVRSICGGVEGDFLTWPSLWEIQVSVLNQDVSKTPWTCILFWGVGLICRLLCSSGLAWYSPWSPGCSQIWTGPLAFALSVGVEPETLHPATLLLFIAYLPVAGIELETLHRQGKHSIAWVTAQDFKYSLLRVRELAIVRCGCLGKTCGLRWDWWTDLWSPFLGNQTR